MRTCREIDRADLGSVRLRADILLA